MALRSNNINNNLNYILKTSAEPFLLVLIKGCHKGLGPGIFPLYFEIHIPSYFDSWQNIHLNEKHSTIYFEL